MGRYSYLTLFPLVFYSNMKSNHALPLTLPNTLRDLTDIVRLDAHIYLKLSIKIYKFKL